MNLKEECGVTNVSLHNAKELLFIYGCPQKLIFHRTPSDCDFSITAIWKVTQHVFTGMSWGYCGEGCRGTETFLKAMGIHFNASARTENEFVIDNIRSYASITYDI